MGYFYDENSDDPFSCSDDFITGNLYKKYNFIDLMEAIADKNYYAWRNRALKKATDTIIKVSEKNMELSDSDKFFLILAEYAGSGLYNLKNMQKEMQKLINAGVNQQTILSYLMPYGICDFNENKCNAISSLMYELPNLTYNVEEAFRKLQAKYLVEYAAFINGYFNFFNDGIYNTVQISRFNEYSILSVFDSSYVSEDYYYLYPRFYKELYGENKKSSSLEYTPLHCTDNVYFGNLYIFPYDNTTYIINTTKYENKILKIEVRSPKLFNTGYDNHYSIEPLIRTNSKSKVIENLSLYRVSSMDTFSYKDNVIYSQEFSRNIFADILGDIEREYDIRGEKISPDKMKKLFNISKFAVKNYRGFSDRIEWDLSNPSNYTFNTFAIKDGIVKNGIIYGPNGSGKSNLALALFDIILHLTQKSRNQHQMDTIINVYHPNDLMSFEYTFRFGQNAIEYYYSKDLLGIVKEKLILDGEVLFNLENNTLYIESDEFPMAEDIKKQLANSSNKVSILGYLWSVYPLTSVHPLKKMKEFVDGMLLFWNHEERGFAGLEDGISYIEEYIISNKLIDDFSQFLKSISNQDFKFKTANAGDKQLICDIGDGVPFSKIRSTGTSSLTLLYFWSQKMSKATFVMIDEFDAFYHFDLSFKEHLVL